MPLKYSTKTINDELSGQVIIDTNRTNKTPLKKPPVASEELIKASELYRNVKPEYDKEKDLYYDATPEETLKQEQELLNKKKKSPKPFYPPGLAPSKESLDAAAKKLQGVTMQYDADRGMYYFTVSKASIKDQESSFDKVNTEKPVKRFP